ncbi:hypothetical protein CEXT_256321 [Caerostris extrusa]|uniref:Uncharacterized protein n=1 Tax=Caerostris extrusa TaxID=172846 RepID=A0AAV4M749_CAEEX|nr:hypothetical protein CEXT_256321 [Caerostris extrusa]
MHGKVEFLHSPLGVRKIDFCCDTGSSDCKPPRVAPSLSECGLMMSVIIPNYPCKRLTSTAILTSSSPVNQPVTRPFGRGPIQARQYDWRCVPVSAVVNFLSLSRFDLCCEVADSWTCKLKERTHSFLETLSLAHRCAPHPEARLWYTFGRNHITAALRPDLRMMCGPNTLPHQLFMPRVGCNTCHSAENDTFQLQALLFVRDFRFLSAVTKDLQGAGFSQLIEGRGRGDDDLNIIPNYFKQLIL